MWNTRCSERWKPGNHRDVLAQAALDTAIEAEFAKGLTDSFPARSRYLFTEHTVSEILSSSVSTRSSWLRSVEAARLYCEPVDDTGETSYAPERSLLRQWLATGRF